MAPTRTTKDVASSAKDKPIEDVPASSASASGSGADGANDLTVPAPLVSATAHLPKSVIVHPLVLLSAVDHFYRVSKDSRKRVVGILLGQRTGDTIDVSNSFAVPFEEDERDPSVWFCDHNFIESMHHMYKRIAAKEHIVGWYHTGPKLRTNDLAINELLQRFVPHPLLVIIDVEPKELGLPTSAYMTVEEIHSDGSPTSKTFEHIASEIQAEEAEEVGVEHLLRDVKSSTAGTLSERITNQLASLRSLLSHLSDIHGYLDKVATGALPMNHQITYQLQDIFNLLPNVTVDELVSAISVETNDQMLVVYVSSLVRAIIALHNLISNKLANRDAEKKTEQSIARSLEDTISSGGKTKDGPTAKA
ncbi:proteasome 26S non-ATPase subunit 7 [Capsaspora owczarzaki ATCC 30864]|uniref:Proteasome 26S non-ATPase subunit 7 n=1 Tax=Capsaspora owczarzaki (strain ATCC 30864) TaxID=595528 RepID=A0A0D2U647_CAPO3|nr:proteasome 26S non-ATPase subunit 7 [Capsaspora owczarzaki ATCC 30864]KJE90596.1 proteasome 26S non-ATPase subunit 7 [Capsaspora owczarzaki ATCC 30864]|eukprot:XP_004364758.1 proteasome 26S non-ATPase subunit 7 [Capsaspora owczarzaki ATCC 30864]